MNEFYEADFTSQWKPIILLKDNDHHATQINELIAVRKPKVFDEIESQVGDWLKLQNPKTEFSQPALKNEIDAFFARNDRETFGAWVYYPWKNALVHVLPEQMFAEVRTVRNRYKITPGEQKTLSEKKVGVVGLSVGQSIALAITLERSCGELRLADFDVLELGNMNRVRSGLMSLGLKKSTIAAREIAEIDPFLPVVVFDEGVDENNVDDFLTRNGKLDLLIDECDSLDVKVLLRNRCREYGIPVIMDTSDRGMLDVERFDLEPHREIFHGMIGDLDSQKLQRLNREQRVTYGLKITGLDTLSPRMKASLIEINQTIASWPQLASAVFLGGALGAHASREILLGKSNVSGRFFVDLDEFIGRADKIDDTLERNYVTKYNPLTILHAEDDGQSLISPYVLTDAELDSLLHAANSAPSGGNSQPWHWVYEPRAGLRLFHDQGRSESLLDYQGTGSLLAFGAALENLRLASAAMGIKAMVRLRIEAFGQQHIADVIFEKNSETGPLNDPYLYLNEAILSRTTNRLNQSKQKLPYYISEELINLATAEGVRLTVFDSEEEIGKLSEISGEMDRLRIIHERGYKNFVAEIRWTTEEAERTRDGIDLRTFDLKPGDLEVLKLIKDADTMAFIRAERLGDGFSKISKRTFESASAIGLLSVKKFSPESFLRAGKVLQRIWLHTHLKKIGFQPVSALVFLFCRYRYEDNPAYNEFEKDLLSRNLMKFNDIIGLDEADVPAFMFRLHFTEGSIVESLRRDVSETLTKK